MVILDTNILIYSLSRDERYIDFIEKLNFSESAISVVTYMEVLVGIKRDTDQKHVQKVLDNLEVISLTREIGFEVASIIKKLDKQNIKNVIVPDLVIGQTALSLGVPLLTNNPKDFKIFEGLEIISPQLL
jgi:predicted nucleic acid-binding protein